MQWLKPKKSNGWIALRSTDHATFIASVITRAQQKPLVTLAASENISIRDKVDIKPLVKKYKLAQSKVSFLVDTKDYQLVQVEKPKVPDNELNEAVRWQLKDLVNFPVEDATLDTIKIPRSPQASEHEDYVYAIACPNTFIAQISNQLLSEKVNLQAIDVRMMAQRNIANLLATEGQGEAILTFGKNSALLTFTYQGEIYNARRIEIDEDKSASAFEKIALELQRSLDGFEAKFRHIFIKKLLVAPFDAREEFCQHLRDAIYTKVETFDLEDIFDFEASAQISNLAQQASFLHVLGAAMREEVAA
jgi:MSHA biogenesis protein MshI